MISSFIFILLGTIGILLESTLMQIISINGILPDLSILIVVSFALFHGPREGGFVGLMIGLIQELLFSRVIGLYSAILLLVGYYCGLFSTKMSNASLFFYLLLATAADLFSGLAQYIFSGFLQGDIFIWQAVSHVILPEVLYTILFAAPLFYFYRLIHAGTVHLDAYADRFLFLRDGE